jgi:hypothetical protein
MYCRNIELQRKLAQEYQRSRFDNNMARDMQRLDLYDNPAANDYQAYSSTNGRNPDRDRSSNDHRRFHSPAPDSMGSRRPADMDSRLRGSDDGRYLSSGSDYGVNRRPSDITADSRPRGNDDGRYLSAGDQGSRMRADRSPGARRPSDYATDDRSGRRPSDYATDDRSGRRPSDYTTDDRSGRRPSDYTTDDRYGRRPSDYATDNRSRGEDDGRYLAPGDYSKSMMRHDRSPSSEHSSRSRSDRSPGPEYNRGRRLSDFGLDDRSRGPDDRSRDGGRYLAPGSRTRPDRSPGADPSTKPRPDRSPAPENGGGRRPSATPAVDEKPREQSKPPNDPGEKSSTKATESAKKEAPKPAAAAPAAAQQGKTPEFVLQLKAKGAKYVRLINCIYFSFLIKLPKKRINLIF